jgi:hypothetical protein
MRSRILALIAFPLVAANCTDDSATAVSHARPSGESGPASFAAATEAFPSEIEACYVPGSGAIYRINAPTAPSGCRNPSHVYFKWGDGGATGGGWELVRATVVRDAGGFGVITCPEGKFAVNGGFVVAHPQAPGGEALVSTPGMLTTGKGWYLQGDASSLVQAWVTCITS